jgi:hypothetical protein
MNSTDDYKMVEAGEADIPAIRALARHIWPIAYGNILSEEQLAYMLQLMYSTEALQKQLQEGHTFRRSIAIKHLLVLPPGLQSVRTFTNCTNFISIPTYRAGDWGAMLWKR